MEIMHARPQLRRISDGDQDDSHLKYVEYLFKQLSHSHPLPVEPTATVVDNGIDAIVGHAVADLMANHEVQHVDATMVISSLPCAEAPCDDLEKIQVVTESRVKAVDLSSQVNRVLDDGLPQRECVSHSLSEELQPAHITTSSRSLIGTDEQTEAGHGSLQRQEPIVNDVRPSTTGLPCNGTDSNTQICDSRVNTDIIIEITTPFVFVLHRSLYVSPSMAMDDGIMEEWEIIIRPRLGQSLIHEMMRGTCMVELMMAGRSRSCLKHTIMVTCGDSSTRRSIERIFKKLEWLKNLLRVRKMAFVTVIQPINLSAKMVSRQDPSPVSNSGLQAGAIAGIVVSVSVVCAVVSLTMWFLRRRKTIRKREPQKERVMASITEWALGSQMGNQGRAVMEKQNPEHDSFMSALPYEMSGKYSFPDYITPGKGSQPLPLERGSDQLVTPLRDAYKVAPNEMILEAESTSRKSEVLTGDRAHGLHISQSAVGAKTQHSYANISREPQEPIEIDISIPICATRCALIGARLVWNSRSAAPRAATVGGIMMIDKNPYVMIAGHVIRGLVHGSINKEHNTTVWTHTAYKNNSDDDRDIPDNEPEWLWHGDGNSEKTERPSQDNHANSIYRPMYNNDSVVHVHGHSPETTEDRIRYRLRTRQVWSSYDTPSKIVEEGFESPDGSGDWALLVTPSYLNVTYDVLNSINVNSTALITETTTEVVTGPVDVICHEKLYQGILRASTSMVKIEQDIFNTQMIVLNETLPDGCSGSWVIFDGKLCGHVIMKRENVPWAYMIPIHKTIEDMKERLGTDDIRLPKKGEIRHHTRALVVETPCAAINGSDVDTIARIA